MESTNEMQFESFAEIIANTIIENKKNRINFCILHKRLHFIKAIDSIECNVLLIIQRQNCEQLPIKVLLEIDAKNIMISDGTDSPCNNWNYYGKTYSCLETKESIAIVLKEMIDKIRLLKFDRRDCRFRTQEEININSSLISMFSSIDNVETNLDKCCVCHEKTSVLTSCNHHICIPCADKVLSITQEEYDDDYNVRKCPMCRQGNITEMPITFIRMLVL